MDNKFYVEAEISIEKETPDLKEKASKVIDLPEESKKQPDLLYFSAILVSSGENLNHAYFMGSELVAAEDTIVNKALDVEHEEQEIIGHIYERAYMDKKGNKFELSELASKETASLDNTDMHIAIAGIIYKNRFPNLAKEVADNKFKVSMECYYQNYDIKIGNVIMTKNEAESLGLASEQNNVLGKMAKIIKKGKEIATGKVARVLRGICFSGCGIVKNPANPASIIMETANNKDEGTDMNTDEIIILNYDKLDKNNNVTSDTVEGAVFQEESRDGNLDDSSGICVSYKRRLYDKAEQVVAENYCMAYSSACTSFSRDTSDPDCLRNKDIQNFVEARVLELSETSKVKDRRSKLLDGLKAALREAVKTLSL